MNHSSGKAQEHKPADQFIPVVGIPLEEAIRLLGDAHGLNPQTAAEIWAFENGERDLDRDLGIDLEPTLDEAARIDTVATL